ncbi:MAG TPA: hypothetical protein VMZ29_17110 [Candidatus Bathyarchaeia archaeon]|nr:hypothetical protein [Candidatus Bathyarchaeia archaeon]
MTQITNFKRIICFIFIIISFSSIIPTVYAAKGFTLNLNSNNSTADESISLDENMDDSIVNSVTTNSFGDEGIIMGESLRVSPNSLYYDDYVVAIDSDGIYYCIFLEVITVTGYTITFTHSLTSDGTNWSTPKPIFRIEKTADYLQAIVDSNKILHIFFIMELGSYYRVFHLYYNLIDSSIQVNFLATTRYFVLYDLKATISHNDTINVAWIAKSKASTIPGWNSLIHLQRFNITTHKWLPEPLYLQNSTNPIKFDIAGDYDNLRIAWSTSNNFTVVQDLMIITFNENTKLWTTPKNLTRSDKTINTINIETSLDGGFHLLWIKEDNYYSLRYIKCASNESILNITGRINDPLHICSYATIIEEASGDCHLIINDLKGFNYKIFYRKRFAVNESWSNLIEMKLDHGYKNLFFFKAKNSSLNRANLFYTKEGSIYSITYSLTEIWSDDLLIYYGIGYSSDPSMIIDSDGIMHLVYYQLTSGRHELIYQTKLMNETNWRLHGNINHNISNWVDPKLVLLPNNTLYCFYVGIEPTTDDTTICYLKKLNTPTNWSEPVGLFTPTGPMVLDKPDILIDSTGTMHVIWLQSVYDSSVGLYFIHIFYTYKTAISSTFTIPVRLSNSQEASHSYHFYTFLDMDDTLHLANCEYTEYYNIASLIYRSKPLGGSWSPCKLLTASYDYLFSPKIIQDSTRKLQLMFNEATEVSLYRYIFWTDFGIFEKMPEDVNWVYNGYFLRDTGSAGFYDLSLAPDNTLYLVFYEGSYSGNWWWRYEIEHLSLIIRFPNGTWSGITRLKGSNNEKFDPIIKYNAINDQLYIVHNFENSITWYSSQYDTDNDLIGDVDEVIFCTDPNSADTDQDGLTDGYEIKTSHTNPLLNDTDWDTIIDGVEVNIYSSDPLTQDTDRDGLTDQEEILIYFSNPTIQDSDGDFLDDYLEIKVIGSSPISTDSDSDGMSDYWEYQNSLNLIFDDSQDDDDMDDLNNLGEFLAETSIFDSDSDDDLLTDGEEVLIYLTNPLNADTDYDTLTDFEEIFEFFTNPFLADSDGDGFSDRSEINAGTDPMDPKDNLQLRQLRKILLIALVPLTTIIITTISFEINYRRRLKKLYSYEVIELSMETAILEEITKNGSK